MMSLLWRFLFLAVAMMTDGSLDRRPRRKTTVGSVVAREQRELTAVVVLPTDGMIYAEAFVGVWMIVKVVAWYDNG